MTAVADLITDMAEVGVDFYLGEGADRKRPSVTMLNAYIRAATLKNGASADNVQLMSTGDRASNVDVTYVDVSSGVITPHQIGVYESAEDEATLLDISELKFFCDDTAGLGMPVDSVVIDAGEESRREKFWTAKNR